MELYECMLSIKNQTCSKDIMELILVHDLDNIKIPEEFMSMIKKTVFIESESHLGISKATNLGVENSQGEYLILLDQDDKLKPDALEIIFEFLTADLNPSRLSYSNYDRISENGSHLEFIRAPKFEPIRARSLMYGAHLKVIQRTLWDELSGYRPMYDGCQDYDFFLRAMEICTPVRIDANLYEWRESKNSAQTNLMAKPEIVERSMEAIKQSWAAIGLNPSEIRQPLKHAAIFQSSFDCDGDMSFSIVIPTNFSKLFSGEIAVMRCIQSLLATYSNKQSAHELLIVVNRIANYPDEIRNLNELCPGIKWVETGVGPFNFSASVNMGVKLAEKRNVLILNDDTEFITKNWTEQVSVVLNLPNVGVVGAKLYYPDMSYQHVGIGIDSNGHCYHPLVNGRNTVGAFGEGLIDHEVDAVTGAFLATTKDVWSTVGGFSEEFPSNYNDVVFCLMSWKIGKSVIQMNTVELIHYESISRIPDRSDIEIEKFNKFFQSKSDLRGHTLTPENLSHTPAENVPIQQLSLSKLRASISHRGIIGFMKHTRKYLKW
jgi:O-antigen biosynthesis protein